MYYTMHTIKINDCATHNNVDHRIVCGSRNFALIFLKHLHNSIISLSNMIGVSPYDYFGQSPFIGATVQGQESERSCICVGFFYDLCFCFCFVICWGFFFGGWGSTLSVFTIFRQNCGIVLTVYYLLFQLQPIIGDN